MRKRVQRDDLEFSARDVTMIFAIAAGIPTREIGKYLSITERGVNRWIAYNRDRIGSMADMLSSWNNLSKIEIKREGIDDLLGELRGLDRAAMESLEHALMCSDKRLSYEAGKELRDRRLGLPKSTVAHEGRVDHAVMHTIDPKVLELLEQDIMRDAELMEKRAQLQIGAEVIDVEPSS